MRRMGFWKEEDKGKTRDEVLKYEHHQVSTGNILIALKYMKAAKVYKRYRGSAMCRICGDRLGGADMITSDGQWTFPSEWDHYILLHGIRPTEGDFITDAIRWNRRMLKQGKMTGRLLSPEEAAEVRKKLGIK